MISFLWKKSNDWESSGVENNGTGLMKKTLEEEREFCYD